MKHWRRIIITIYLILCLITVNGCATSGLSSEPIKFEQDYFGMIIGSITFTKEKARYHQYFLNVQAIASSEKISDRNSKEIQITPNQITRMRHAGELDEGKTYLFALQRVPGKYQISKLRLATVGMGYAIPNDLITGFSIPIDVKKGEIIYVGNILINEYAHVGDSVINLQDNFERDIGAFKTKQPSMNWNNAKKSRMEINNAY